MVGLLNQAGEYKRRCDGVATTCFAEPLILVGFHLRRVVASLRHADGGTHTLSGGHLQEIVETIEAFEIAGVPGRLGKATSRTPSMYVDEKSDEAIVLAKRPNKGRQLPAEVVEGRASPKGNSR
jgi:hypothetical protein